MGSGKEKTVGKAELIFFVGTTAELIKIFPVVELIRKADIPYRVISSGQNELHNTDIIKTTGINIDLQLSSEDDIKKTLWDCFRGIFLHCSDQKSR